MSASELKSLPCLGFLTVCEHSPHGLFGGYLILNMHGRPLEFHCTAPVKPNRAQEILYGPTLAPFLYGEQIGHALLTKARLKPEIVCTDVEPALCVDPLVESSVVWVPESSERISGKYSTIRARDVEVAARASTTERLERIGERLESFMDHADLREPFGRIRDALDEARNPSKAA